MGVSMSPGMNKEQPSSKADIIRALNQLHNSDLQYWLDFNPDQFATPIRDGWSPAENVLHLTKSTKPLILGLQMPHIMLGLLFGKAKSKSCTYQELQTRYRQILQNGGKAGRFAPAKPKIPNDRRSWQQELIKNCQNTLSKLTSVVNNWSEEDLDQYRLPHPLIGKLSVREMLFFTIYHYDHHKNNVIKKLQN